MGGLSAFRDNAPTQGESRTGSDSNRGVSLEKALGDLVLVGCLGADVGGQITVDVIENRFATRVTSRDAAVAGDRLKSSAMRESVVESSSRRDA